jgi:large subunit ribosomal protein L10
MALGRYIKEEMRKTFEEKVNNARTIILCRAGGLKAAEFDELRVKISKENANFFLIKKTLASKVFQKAKIDITPSLEGDTYYAFSRDDPVAISKLLVGFSRAHEALKIKGGVLDKQILDADEIKKYASLPSKEVLLQQIMFRIKAPMSNLALVLRGSLQKLVLVLDAIRGAKENDK